MRKSLDFAWAAGHQPKGGVVCVALALAIPLLATGCGKQSQTPAPTASTPQDINASQPAPATPAPAVNSEPAPAATATNALPDLRTLNQALLGWIIQNRRHPANFEEFAASANIQIPPPPAGKKYILNSRGLISLVNAN